MDINCDLGEGEALSRTRALLRCVTSANIACGGHAGSLRSLQSCLRLCKELGVKAGAHPGYNDRENFGRVYQELTAPEFELLLAQQIGAFLLVAKSEGISLSHVKLHGALYHAAEKEARLAKVFISHMLEHHPKARIYVLEGGELARLAQRMGAKVWGEIYADRRYRPDGQLTPRNEPGAVLEDPEEVKTQMLALRSSKLLANAQTICVHSDSPGALRTARLLKTIFS